MTESAIKWVVLGALGLLALWSARSGLAGEAPITPFVINNRVRSYRPEVAQQLAAVLDRLDVGPAVNGVERTYTLVARGQGLKHALAAVRDLQAAGNLVAGTTNLLGGDGPRTLASMKPSEVEALVADREGVALLPKV